MEVKSLSHVQLFATAWTTAYQAPPSIGFPRQEYWSGLPLPSPPIKIPMVFFRELEQIISQSVWKYRKPRIAKAILGRRMELEESTCLTSDYYKATVIKIVRYRPKDRNIDQWNKIESPEINPHTYGHLIFENLILLEPST